MSGSILRLPMQFFAEDADFNALDGAQEPVVEAQGDASGDGVTPDDTPAQEPAKPAQKPAQTPEENAAFAKVRREAEARAQELAQKQIDDEYKRLYEGQPNPYTGRPIESKADYVEYERQHALHQMAEKSGISVQEQEALLKKTLQGLPEYQKEIEQRRQAEESASKYLGELIQRKMADDLAEIKKANPQETAHKIDDLGPTFLKLVGAGLDALTAYDVVLRERQRQAPPPPSMGDIGGGTDDAEFYTLEQLKSMSPEDMRKNWTKVEKSRKHIFK